MSNITNLSEDQIKAYHKDGYAGHQEILQPKEINKLYETAIEDSSISQKCVGFE